MNQELPIFCAKINLSFIPKRARRSKFKTLQVNADTREQAVVNVLEEFNAFKDTAKELSVLCALSFVGRKTVYPDGISMVFVPLWPKSGNHACETFEVIV